MEHENAYSLMMDALDGELTDSNQADLAAHLRACPTCTREWQALQAIETLFRQTPVVQPTADFAQRTLAILPNRHYRVWAITIIYIILLFSGLTPLLVGGVAITTLRPVFDHPTVLESLLLSAEKMLQVVAAVLNALLISLGEFIIQQPSILGWLLVMIGMVSLWSGVFQQLVIQPRRI